MRKEEEEDDLVQGVVDDILDEREVENEEDGLVLVPDLHVQEGGIERHVLRNLHSPLYQWYEETRMKYPYDQC